MRRDDVLALREALVGKRIRCVLCTDSWSPVPTGTVGTVTSVDDVGTVHVAWDNGSRLGLVPDADRWEVIS